MATPKYVNGIFIEQKEGPFGTFLSIGITEAGLQELKNLPVSAKGWRNLTATPQKDNHNKYSVKPYSPGKPQETVSGNPQQETDGDSLPF